MSTIFFINFSDTDDGQNDKTVQEPLASTQIIQPGHLQTTTKSSTVTPNTSSTTTAAAVATATVKQVSETNKKWSPTSAVYQKPPKVPSDLEVSYSSQHHSGTHCPTHSHGTPSVVRDVSTSRDCKVVISVMN